jgi:hypothetical protein
MSFTGKPASTLAQTIENDGFWPNVEVGPFLDQYRIPAEYQDAMILGHLREAIIETNHTLRPAKSAALALGHLDLDVYAAATGSEAVGGVEVLVTLYLAAVGNLAKAKLLRQFATINRRPVAENEAKSAPETEDHFLDEHQRVVTRILSRMAPDAAGPTDYGAYVALL